MEFVLYNTLSRAKEKFVPLHKDRVDFYSCGPTVYNRVHIGNLRAFLMADTLYRWLRHGMKYNVRWVMNITDVDDKTIRDSKAKYPEIEPKAALKKLTTSYEEEFLQDLEALNISQSSFYALPRATEHITDMQDLIRKVYKNGYAYEKEGSLYLSIEKYAKSHVYGRLKNISRSELKSGTRTLADEGNKDCIDDFALWKTQKKGEPYWDFDLNGVNYPGRPGWHIECSAMEHSTFGSLPFDIHSGGVDLCFPHHEDEITQSVAGYKEEPTKYWFHNEHLMVEGKKMSKSLGNFYTLEDLLQKGHSADAIRFFLITNHYRTKLNLTQEALIATAQSLQRIRNALLDLPQNPSKKRGSSHAEKKLEQSFCDDLNTPAATAAIFTVLGEKKYSHQEKRQFFEYAEKLFGVRFLAKNHIVPSEIKLLAEQRQQAKKEKNFEKADFLRNEISAKGFEIRDSGNDFTLVPKQL